MTARVLRVFVAVLLVVSLSGLPAIAADASVAGRAIAVDGPVDPTWQVRVTPLAGGTPVLVPIVNGSYKVEKIPEGPYEIAVVGADGAVIGDPARLGVVAGPNTVDMVVGPAVVAGGAVSDEAEASPPSGKKKHTVWWIFGGIAAAGLLYWLLTDDDPPASPM